MMLVLLMGLPTCGEESAVVRSFLHRSGAVQRSGLTVLDELFLSGAA